MKKLKKKSMDRNNKGQFTKGHKLGKRFQKGQPSWMKGKKHTDKTKEKMKLHHKGTLGKHWKLSEIERENIRKGSLKFYASERGKKAKERISEDNKKNPRRYWLGKKRPEMTGNKSFTKRPEIRKKLRMAQMKIISEGKHNWWKGGISYRPYSVDWTDTLKRSIRERDNYICQICNQYGNNVHHIDYDKDNCNPKNLITLCHHCHLMTNNNRNYWKKYFNEK